MCPEEGWKPLNLRLQFESLDPEVGKSWSFVRGSQVYPKGWEGRQTSTSTTCRG
jgi:hypothetical protein